MKTATTLTLALFFLMTPVCRAEYQLILVRQQDSLKTSKLIRQIAKENIYAFDDRENTIQQNNYRRFSQSASTYDFIKIAMENKNPIVRIYAFRAVAERMDNIPAELALKFKTDTTTVKVSYGRRVKEVPLNQIINGFLK